MNITNKTQNQKGSICNVTQERENRNLQKKKYVKKADVISTGSENLNTMNLILKYRDSFVKGVNPNE